MDEPDLLQPTMEQYLGARCPMAEERSFFILAPKQLVTAKDHAVQYTIGAWDTLAGKSFAAA